MNKKANVLVFFTDQQRYDTSKLYGNTSDLTPNFDQMAMEATHLYNAFTPQPVCLPARTCLQTGIYPSKLGVYCNEEEMPIDTKTLGNYFKESGYNTNYIGKWHMSHDEPVPREKRSGYDYWLAANVLEFSSDAYETYVYNDDGEKVFLPGYRVDALTDAAIDRINKEKDKDEPFFMFVSYLEPHHQNTRDSFIAPKGFEQRYIDGFTPPDLASLGGSSKRHLPGYYGMVKKLDDAFGRVQDALYSMNLSENTIVVYTSDHGCHFKTRNAEYKRTCHDSSIRIPMAISGPGFERGGRVKELVSLVDLAPTLLDACQISIPEVMDGDSIYKLINDRSYSWADDVYSEIKDSGIIKRSVRTKRWKYCVEEENGNYKPCNLYDLKEDPWEMENQINNLAYEEVIQVMTQRLKKYLLDVGDNKEINLPILEAKGQFYISKKEAHQ